MGSSKRTKRAQQLGLVFFRRGGKRDGAGRKPKGEVAGVAHSTRERLSKHHPVHVSMKAKKGLASLRSRKVFREIRTALHAHPEKLGMRVCEFSVQSNHIHLVVEATGKEGLSRGMQGLTIRIAKAVNRALERAGSVFADRYFSRILKTPLEVKRALAYVLNNAIKHGSILLGIDPCSSGPWFEGWRHAGQSPVGRARTWLLREGWRRHGAIELAEPGAHER